jgi:Lipid A core - O-antigen ligase and related enzymes
MQLSKSFINTIGRPVWNVLLISLIFLALITSFIYSNELYLGVINAKKLWLYGVIGLVMLSIGIYWVLNTKPISFQLNLIDISLLAFYFYIFTRSAFTHFTPLLYNTQFLNYTLLVIFYFWVKSVFCKNTICTNSFSPEFLDSQSIFRKKFTIQMGMYWWLCSIFILTGLIQAVWGLLQLFSISLSFHNYFKITGTFYNPAPYAIYLAVIFPFALGMFHLLKDDKIHNKILKYVSLLTFMVILLVLPATRIRAAWLASFLGGLFVYWPALQHSKQLIFVLKLFKTRIISKITITSILTILIALTFLGLYKFKEGSSSGKLFIWEVSMGIVKQNPILGIGVHRFNAEYNQYQAKWFQAHPNEMDSKKGMVGGDTKYAFNEYLEILVETGIVGLFLFISVILATIYLVVKNLKNNILLYLFFASIIVIFISASFSFPFYSLPTFVIFFFLLAAISGLTSYPEYKEKNKLIIKFSFLISRLFFIRIAGIVMVILSSLLLIFATNQYKAYYYWGHPYLANNEGNYDACYSFNMAYPYLKYDGEFLQNYGVLLFENKQLGKSYIILNKAQSYISNEKLYTSLGDLYKAVGNLKKNEEAYINALYFTPQRFSPIYNLAKFYEETGQIDKALIIAQRILIKKPKIAYDDIIQFKQEMLELLKKYKMDKTINIPNTEYLKP